MKNKKRLSVFKIGVAAIFLCAVFALIFTKNNFEKSPEYSIYQTVIAIKNKDYQTFSNYVDTKEIAAKIAEDIEQDILKKPELTNLPNQEIISEMLDAIAEEQKTKIQEDFKNDIKNGKYAKELESIPNCLLYAGLIIKKHDKYEITVKNNSSTSAINIKIGGQSKGKLTLENRNSRWVITKIQSDYINAHVEKSFPKLDKYYFLLNKEN